LKKSEGPRVLVLANASPDDRKTLAAIRSLGRAGYRLTVAGESFRARSFHSRFARERALIPHPAQGLEQFFAALRELLQKRDYAAVFPTTDNTAFALSQSPEQLPASLGSITPDPEAAAICKDKLRTAELSAKLGLAMPLTFCPADFEELNHLAQKLRFPCILKPRATSGAIGLTIASTREQLLHAYTSMPDIATAVFNFRQPLVQEFIRGRVHEVCALFNRGQPRALLSQKRLLMHPANGGAGIYNETTDEPDLKELAVKLLQALDWHGPAQVEFIRDCVTGQPYLLEVNGRFWGTLDLSIAAGMDFPVMACRMAIEGDVQPQFSYRVGLRYRWPFPFAILHAMETGRWARDFRDFLLPRRATCSDLCFSDPLPLIMELVYTFRRFRKNRFKTIRSTQNWSEVLANDFLGDSSDN